GGLLDYYAMAGYLNASQKEFHYILLSDFVLAEPKTGIGRDKATGTAKDHMLYRVTMRRLEPRMRKGSENQATSILVDFTGLDLPERGLLKLGGEGKAVFYETPGPDVEKSLCFTAPELCGGRFKLYLATPALFAGGWLPGWLDEKTLTGEYRGLKLRLLTAATGKYLSIGGFDMQAGKPKVMRRAVPAGSVYYFEVTGGDPSEVMEVFHRANLSDYCPEQGFGHVLVGGVEDD
ncbi:MAG TPA: type III-B CRISPR module-associated Cmr3 family protein, partial [Bacillota bacterium]|nr:type III-B CRISPR module-associated Cmr3 family protein [Bacillota bacterium]